MRYFISALTALLFFIWIIPLGVFIKPSQEKNVCDGQRAMCMCHFSYAKVKSSPIVGFGFKSNSGSNKESSGSSGSGNYFLASNFHVANALQICFLNHEKVLNYLNPSIMAFEPVPKV